VTTPVVVKFGGELLEDPNRLKGVVKAIGRAAAQACTLVIVHGGGKEIDAALASAGVEKRQVDGLRITDDQTLDVVVTVLGSINTRLVVALAGAGVAAVGLTGADGLCGLADPAPPHRAVDGRLVDLGRVGLPSEASETKLLTTMMNDRFVPVVACIGIDRHGQLLNVNADTLAGHLAARLGAARLVVAGATPGVLDGAGRTVPVIGRQGIEDLVGGRTATAGMIAKLRACEQALSRGVGAVTIVDGRDPAALEAAVLGTPPPTATRIVSEVAQDLSPARKA
jgi:acetylglutamate kinase